MADPATIAAISLIATIGQTVTGIASAASNAQAAKAEAESLELAAAADARKDRRRSQHILSKQRAIAGASGVDPGSGSPLIALLDSAKEAELDAQTILSRGRLGAEGKKAEARSETGKIFGQAFGGVAQSGSILGQFMHDRKARAKKTTTSPKKKPK